MKKPSRSVNWGGGGSKLALLLALAALLLLVAADAPDAMAHVQPALRDMATAQPAEAVRIIVQHAPGSDIAAAVEEAGGAVVHRLDIIDATVAELPAGGVAHVAAADGVRWVSLDAPVASASTTAQTSYSQTVNYYLDTLNVQPVRQMGLDGRGIGVAIIDSGINVEGDVKRRIYTRVNFSPSSKSSTDAYGHGTHVAGIIGGDGTDSNGFYTGVAPGVNFIGVKMTDNGGMAYESDTVAAMQWVLNNKDLYNIRVVNLSINSTAEQSYHTSPLDAAAEILWFNGIVVVASAGNIADGAVNTINAAPANDPFIITVGATTENGTAARADDAITPYSAAGITLDGVQKPELYAPGQNIVSVLSNNSTWATQYPERVVYFNGKPEYFRLSGTSMSAPMVTGAVALLLQDEPHLNPDQVKYRLLSTAGTVNGVPGYLDVYAAVTGSSTETANTGTAASQLLWTGASPVNWGSVNWGSVNWGSVNWGSVNWGSVNWGSVNWGSVNWGN